MGDDISIALQEMIIGRGSAEDTVAAARAAAIAVLEKAGYRLAR